MLVRPVQWLNLNRRSYPGFEPEWPITSETTVGIHILTAVKMHSLQVVMFCPFQVMEPWSNETDRGKPNYAGKTLSQCHFVHHNSHMDWLESKPARRCGRPTANHLSHDRTVFVFKPEILKVAMNNADRKGCSLLSSHIYKFPKFKFQNLHCDIDNEGWQAVTELSPFQPSVTHYKVSFAVPCLAHSCSKPVAVHEWRYVIVRLFCNLARPYRLA
jgi:hypothetical protein